MPSIDSVSLSPSIVFTGSQFVISVAITDPFAWLLDQSEIFLIDSENVFLLEGGSE